MTKQNPALTLFTTGTTNPQAPAGRDIPIDPWHAILLCAFVIVAAVVGFMVVHNVREDRRKRARVRAADARLQASSHRLREATTNLRLVRMTMADAPTMPMDYSQSLRNPAAAGSVATLADADVWGDVPAPVISEAGRKQRLRVVSSMRT